MTREEAEFCLMEAGQVDDDAFPLLEAAIACAIHDYPFRDAEPVRVLQGRDATESTFKQTAHEYRVLHVATHGFGKQIAV